MRMVVFTKWLWLIAITAACWTIWIAINGLIFDKKSFHGKLGVPIKNESFVVD